MKLTVLGCSGAEFPGHYPSAFLIDDALLLDGGTIGSVLEEDRQASIRTICITHSHLDHVRGIPALADNIVIGGRSQSVDVLGIPEVLSVLREHLMNGKVWPDFSKIPSPDAPALVYREIAPEITITVGGYSVTACRVNHSVPAVGYLIRKGSSSLLYTGDTGPTDRIWEMAGEVSAVVVEVSFPNAMEQMALLTGHLTSFLLEKELSKLSALPCRIFISHLKPQFAGAIASEIEDLGLPQVEILQAGMIREI